MDDVMQQVQKEQGASSRMSVQDIVRTEIENNGSNANWEDVYKRVYALIQAPQYRILRANNSLFLIYNAGQGNASVYMFNADKVQDMPKSMMEFVNAMKKANFKKIGFNTVRPAVLKLLKSAGINFKSTPSEPEPGTNQPSIHVEVEL